MRNGDYNADVFDVQIWIYCPSTRGSHTNVQTINNVFLTYLPSSDSQTLFLQHTEIFFNDSRTQKSRNTKQTTFYK